MKKRFMLTAAGSAATAFAASASAELLTFNYDYYAGEAGWTIADSGGNVVMSCSAGTNISTTLSYSANLYYANGSSPYPNGYTYLVEVDLAEGDYTITLTDTWGDGWEYFSPVGSGYSAFVGGGLTLAFLSGSSVSGMFTVGGGGGPTDPCDDALASLCPEDLDGDGQVAVSDVLMVIGSWGQMGDGTFRPDGDCAPLPNGDCYVDVSDVLGVVASWGADCAPPPVYGSCCMADESCQDLTAADCSAAGGTYGGDETDCMGANCSVGGGDSCADALDFYDGDNAFDTTTNSASTDLPTCAEDAGAFGWTDPSNDLWGMWTASENAEYIMHTCMEGSFDTSVVVYSGCGGEVDQVACNGDDLADPDTMAPCQAYYSILRFAATAGQTYYIRIGGWGAGDMGAGNLNIGVAPPPVPGACCFDGGSCIDNLNSKECVALTGTFAGEDTLCADGVCDIPTAACCVGETCTEATWEDCLAGGGLPGDMETTCADGVCTLPCPVGYTEDCVGTCFEDLLYTNWIGDGFCDDGSYIPSDYGYRGPLGAPFYANCDLFGCDAGDCEGDPNCSGDAVGACCVGETCTDLSVTDCAAAGGAWNLGDCATHMCAVSLDCPTGSSGQSPHTVDDGWTGATSALDSSAGISYLRAETVGAASMSGMTVWGLELLYSGGWGPCAAGGIPAFNVRAYADGGGMPGTETAGDDNVVATATATGNLYAGLYELVQFDMSFAATNVDWLGVQSADNPDCYFLWMSSGTGDASSALDDGSGWVVGGDNAYDLSVCTY